MKVTEDIRPFAAEQGMGAGRDLSLFEQSLRSFLRSGTGMLWQAPSLASSSLRGSTVRPRSHDREATLRSIAGVC